MTPLILISNDDGIDAPGISALAGALEGVGEVVVVAPDREMSATSHAISLHRPLRVSQRRPGWFAVDGTPADCVYLAMLHLLEGRKPSLLVSGINRGYNLGSDFFYSGTVACAVEGALRGVPACAISLGRGPKEGLEAAGRFARALAHAILAAGLPEKTLLSVNVPNSGPLAGYRFTRLGKRSYRDTVEVRTDLRGDKYFWIGGPELEIEDDPDTDGAAVKENLVAITPLDLDLTSHALLESLPGWNIEGFEAILRREGT
jgi:5'-nucleotidase